MLNEPADKHSTTIKVATETAEEINTLFSKMVEGNSHAAKQIAKKASWNQKITAILADYRKSKEDANKLIGFMTETSRKQKYAE